jgi:hypothetical protein
MRCEHQPSWHGRVRHPRLCQPRGLWQMAMSFQTTRADAPVVTI